MKYKFVSALTIALLSQVSWGQSTAQYTHESKTLQKALSLYYQKQYKASSHFFRKELRRATTQAQKEQCSYYIPKGLSHFSLCYSCQFRDGELLF